jgi:hypothetical protein
MFLNWTAPSTGNNLYHLVFIGEAGNGTVTFLVKTRFGDAALVQEQLPTQVYPQNETSIKCLSNCTDLANATLLYSTDRWANTTSVDMQITDNRTCNATIPAQVAGTKVSYRVEAEDILRNRLSANGSYTVKDHSTLELAAVKETITMGENITVSAAFTPVTEGVTVHFIFTTSNSTKEITATTDANGTVIGSFQTENVSVWQVTASFAGDDVCYPSSSEMITIRVEEQSFLAIYGLYLGGASAGIGTACGVIIVKKKRS